MNVIIPFKYGVAFLSHKHHNPDCDIMVGDIDEDKSVTYGIYVKGPKTGQEFCEYYSGENYRTTSRKRSYSRMWTPDQIPDKYKFYWNLLRSQYEHNMPK